MRARTTLVLLGLLLAQPLTGCIGLLDPDPSSEADGVGPRARAGGGSASLVVTVTDVGRRPVADAQVGFDGPETSLQARTDPMGAARFSDLRAGSAVLEVHAQGYVDRAVRVSIPEEGEVRETVVLQPQATETTFVERHEFHGFFECSATYLIITGDCLVVARAAADRAGYSLGDNATNERFVFPFELREGWSLLEITQTWQEPMAGAGSMMRVNLEPIDQNNTQGHGQRYARAEGSSPTTLAVENTGEAHRTASGEEMVLPEQGGLVRTRTFHLGYEDTHDPAGTGFLGVGASLQQPFTVYVNVTYGGSPGS